ncbi:MAG: hypothetical protein OEM38_10325 [Gammaproteobacteria bacterium]|nr:hypothetical protein [Gammaproteobacteria bacterium]
MNITIAVSDFQYENWAEAFFPDDLPEDWRLDYYANEFGAVLLGERDLEVFGEELIHEFLRGVGENFIFVLEGGLLTKPTEVECALVRVFFPPDQSIVELAGMELEQAKVINRQDVSKSVCVLRVKSDSATRNEDIKQLLTYINVNCSNYDQVCLFFGRRMQCVEVISAAKIINDLL